MLQQDVIATIDKPVNPIAGVVVLKGNFSVNGLVIKPSAVSIHLLQHTGRAVVFEGIEDYKAQVNEPELDIDGNCIMVLKNVGQKAILVCSK